MSVSARKKVEEHFSLQRQIEQMENLYIPLLKDKRERSFLMNALIFSGSGFIGYHLLNALIERSFNPHVVDIKPPLMKGVKYSYVDLYNLSHETPIFKGVDVVYHPIFDIMGVTPI